MTSCFEGQITQEQENSLNPANTKEEHTTLLLQLQKDAPFRIRIEDASQTGPFSFLFGGVGDARHLFGSLLDLECVDWPATRQRFQFTMVDIKEPAIARDLVMFYIFRHISKFTPEQQQKDINAIEVNQHLIINIIYSLSFLIYFVVVNISTLHILEYNYAKLPVQKAAGNHKRTYF